MKKYTYNLQFKYYAIKESKFKNKDFNIKDYGAVEGNGVKQSTEYSDGRFLLLTPKLIVYVSFTVL